MTESSGLIDPFGRKVEYIRLSVTDRCDLRCNYCMPKGFKGFEQPPNWLDFDEIERVLSAFARLGLARVRLTGGEPLLRKDLPKLAARIKSIPGIDDLSLSTNATQLSKHAVDLKQAGVDRINVSLDSLDHQRFAEITGRDSLQKVLDGLEQAHRIGFAPVKINMVMTPQTSEQELDDMVAYCMDNQFVLRLIEIMPMGDTGRNAGFVDLQPIKQRLQQRFDLIDGVVPGAGPARYLKSKDGSFSIGFITPLSQHFCATCNRVRLAVDGTLYLCLGNEHKFEFRPLLRQGISDDELLEAVQHAITLKPERHEFRESPQRIVRFMSHTGG
ncbi:MAG: GTP 3',8-cyclase MoaA [Gammaproteobacteria bacterium]|nr:GTP 3',8-cyclase MoaA [Gammaproteobacteria bacterium]